MWTIWICLLVFSTDISGQTLSGSSTSHAVLNRPFQFTCTGSVTTTTLSFIRDGTSLCIISSPSDPAKCAEFTSVPGYSCSCGSSGVFYMNIANVSLQDEDRWKCGTGDFINLQVYYKPSVSGFPDPFSIKEDTNLSLDCSSYTQSNPAVTSYRWTGPGGYSSVGPVLSISSINRDKTGDFTCTATNTLTPSGGSPQTGTGSLSLTVTVQFAPTVSGQDPSYPVRELSPLNIDCRKYTTVGNPQRTSYRWTGPNSFSSSQPILSISSISRNQAGIYTCRAANTLTPTGGSAESGIGEGQFSVNVQYLDRPILTIDQPEVRENESVGLKCSAQSQPTALLTVRNMDNDTVVVKQQTDELTYTIPRAQCLHNGSFVCNGENEVTGVLYSPIISLNVLCSPRLDTRKPLKRNVSSGLNDIASLLLNVISNPDPTFRWYLSDNQQLVPIPNITKHEVISTAKFSVLQIHVKNVRDYASYVVEATSNHDTIRMTFNLLPKQIDDLGSCSQEPQSDRLGVGIGIGTAAVLSVVTIGIVVYICLRRRDLPRKEVAKANQDTQIEMESSNHKDNRGTYSDLTSTPGNEYEELKVQRSEDSPRV